ncbi:ATP-binding protein, partial [Phenylobacterium sp.]
RPFDLRAELGDLLEVFRGQALAKGLDFPIAYGDAAQGQFVGDAVRLKQVVGNLLSNAVKFTAQGQVSISITLDEPPAGPATLLLEVRDTGVGFPPDFAAALFQRFRQAGSSRFGGAGLGLSITRALVEMMGGEIEAASTLGQGSAFRVSLPLARAPAREAHAPAAPEAHPPRSLSTLRVLLAEDHPINQRVVELILAPYEVALTIVDDGAQALAAHAASRFDLVLMDMQMPVMDGLAATRAIRERERETGAHIPIVMLSANAMTQHRQDAADAGADHHLAKPITAAALIQALDIALPL